MERALARPTRVGFSEEAVAAMGAFTLPYRKPVIGMVALAQPLSTTALTRRSRVFFITEILFLLFVIVHFSCNAAGPRLARGPDLVNYPDARYRLCSTRRKPATWRRLTVNRSSTPRRRT